MSDQPAAQFNIHDAKTNLYRIIERVEHGEEIIISRAAWPPPDYRHHRHRPGRHRQHHQHQPPAVFGAASL